MNDKAVEHIVQIRNARLSFPALFAHEFYDGKDTGKFSVTFLIPKSDKATVQAVNSAIAAAIKDKWAKKAPSDIILTFRDGDDESYDGYADHWSLKASTNRRPALLDRNREPLIPEDEEDKMYAGCYVNASVSFNASTDSYKKNRVWCNLRGVQFYKDGDRFGGGTAVDVNTEFDDFDEDPLIS